MDPIPLYSAFSSLPPIPNGLIEVGKDEDLALFIFIVPEPGME